jgi:hypothetical protein
VTVQTTTSSAASRPSSAARSSPATDAADAGSTKTPSSAASVRYAARISSSVTAPMCPPDSSRAARAPSHDAGLPIWIAVAIVWGLGTRAPVTIGAAPAACHPSMRGRRPALPASRSSQYPRQYAVMLPALPTGMQCTEGASPSAATISNAAVFWPSIRTGLTELTTSTPGCSPSARTMSSASNVPSTGTTFAPWIRAWASLPRAICPAGSTTAQIRPARAAYAAADADVLPVEAQITTFLPRSTAVDTAIVMPRSLNDPVGLAPSTLRRTLATPVR